MAPVARELSNMSGIIEPLQTAMSIGGQVEELQTVLKENTAFPVILIGHSWGAWLSFMFAAEYPSFISKLILVASGPFE
jgi:pimeloyl-ACP methyl ester carboxylesterase